MCCSLLPLVPHPIGERIDRRKMPAPGFDTVVAIALDREEVFALYVLDQTYVIDAFGGGAVDTEDIGVVYVIL